MPFRSRQQVRILPGFLLPGSVQIYFLLSLIKSMWEQPTFDFGYENSNLNTRRRRQGGEASVGTLGHIT